MSPGIYDCKMKIVRRIKLTKLKMGFQMKAASQLNMMKNGKVFVFVVSMIFQKVSCCFSIWLIFADVTPSEPYMFDNIPHSPMVRYVTVFYLRFQKSVLKMSIRWISRLEFLVTDDPNLLSFFSISPEH